MKSVIALLALSAAAVTAFDIDENAAFSLWKSMFAAEYKSAEECVNAPTWPLEGARNPQAIPCRFPKFWDVSDSL